MNTVLSNYGQLCGCPEILKKSCKFFCRGLDIRVTKSCNLISNLYCNASLISEIYLKMILFLFQY